MERSIAHCNSIVQQRPNLAVVAVRFHGSCNVRVLGTLAERVESLPELGKSHLSSSLLCGSFAIAPASSIFHAIDCRTSSEFPPYSHCHRVLAYLLQWRSKGPDDHAWQ